MKPMKIVLILAALALIATGCSSERPKPTQEPVIVDEPPPPPPPPEPAEPTAIPDESAGDPLESDPLLRQRRVFFGFDSSDVQDDFRNMIAAHANYLQNNPNAIITLEGHTDERGTREYNLALGERRARGVRQLLIVQSVSPNQIRFISYGEENPIALGHDEASWAQNRRVEIVYSNQ